jgi:hypothetical protein
MSEGSTAAGAARRVSSGTSRLVRAWRVLPHESRLAAFASVSLFVTLFLPWYQVTLIAPAQSTKLQSASAAITGWGAFSFVEAAVLLVAAGVLTLLFQRAEGKAFHLPGGDGGVITAAGVWTCALVVWRIFDKQGATTNGPSATSSGVEWGIFVALAAAAFLAYSGSRIRAAHRPEPPLPGEDRAPVGSNAAADTTEVPRRRERSTESRQPTRTPQPVPADPAPAVRARAERAPADGPRVDGRAPADAPTKIRARDERAPADAPTKIRARDERAPADAPTKIRARDERAPADHVRPRPGDRPAVEPPDHLTDATPARPRRRASAGELFEQVVPEDPPAMRFGRIPPSSPPSIAPVPAPPEPTAPDEQLTIPFRDDETRAMRDADTHVLREDETLPLGEDETLPLHPRPKRY